MRRRTVDSGGPFLRTKPWKAYERPGSTVSSWWGAPLGGGSVGREGAGEGAGAFERRWSGTSKPPNFCQAGGYVLQRSSKPPFRAGLGAWEPPQVASRDAGVGVTVSEGRGVAVPVGSGVDVGGAVSSRANRPDRWSLGRPRRRLGRCGAGRAGVPGAVTDPVER